MVKSFLYIGLGSVFPFFWGGGGTLAVLGAYSWQPSQVSLLEVLRDPFYVLEIKPRSVMVKTSSLPSRLSLQTQILVMILN